MTIRRRRRSSSVTPCSSFFSSELPVLAILCTLFLLFVLALVIASPLSFAALPDQQEADSNATDNVNVTAQLNAKDDNITTSSSKNGTSFADMIDRALEKEFTENDDQNEGISLDLQSFF